MDGIDTTNLNTELEVPLRKQLLLKISMGGFASLVRR